MKLLKLSFILLFCQISSAVNFSGVQSLVGLNTTKIFTATPDGIYYIQGYLNLPWGSNTGGKSFSRVITTVSKNYTTAIYQGLPGASGFMIPQVSLSAGDIVTVGLSSPVTSDSATGDGLQAVTGQVYFGNAF